MIRPPHVGVLLLGLLVPFVLGGVVPAQELAIAGRVLGTDGEPAADAEVEVRWLARPELPLGAGWSLDGAVRRASVGTDADGLFRFVPPPQQTCLLVASHGARVSAQAFPVTGGDFVGLRLREPLVVRGVVHAAGRPRAGVTVAWTDADDQGWWRRGAYRYPDVGAAVHSDAAGAFALPVEIGYMQHRIWYPIRAVVASTAGGSCSAAPRLFRALPGVDAPPLDLALDAQHVALTVRAADGAPAGGAQIWNTRWRGTAVETDADGRARIAATVSPVWVRDRDGALAQVALDPERAPDMAVRLPPVGRVTVGVVQLRGAPLADARVLVSTPSLDGPPLEWVVHTTADGALEARGLPDGADAHLYVEVDGAFRPLLRATGPGMAVGAVDVPAVRRVAGQVLDADGVPAAHARVALTVDGWPPWTAWADRAGRFAFDVALPGRGRVTLAAQVDGRGLARREVADDAAFDRPIELRVARGRTVQGTVFDDAGETVGGAWVSLFWAAAATGDPPGPIENFAAQVVFADADGRFRFENVPDALSPTLFAVAVRRGMRMLASTPAEIAGEAEGESGIRVAVKPADR